MPAQQRKRLCLDCPKSAGFPDELGRSKRFCASHAKAAGTWLLKKPCGNCPEESKVSASHPDAEGTPNRLCGPCAKIAGTWRLRNPCRNCPEGSQISANYPDVDGTPNRLYSSPERIRSLSNGDSEQCHLEQLIYHHNYPKRCDLLSET